MKSTMEILTKLQENSQKNQDEVFTRLYRYLLRPDIYFIAYQHLYSNKGAGTKGVNDDTADGFSEQYVTAIIEASAQRRCPLLHIKTTAFIHNRSYNLMIDKFSQVAENLPAADRDADRQYHVINGYPVVFSFSKEPNPEAFERIRNILLATSYTKKVG